MPEEDQPNGVGFGVQPVAVDVAALDNEGRDRLVVPDEAPRELKDGAFHSYLRELSMCLGWR